MCYTFLFFYSYLFFSLSPLSFFFSRYCFFFLFLDSTRPKVNIELLLKPKTTAQYLFKQYLCVQKEEDAVHLIHGKKRKMITIGFFL
jgi:hypothetical protein